MWLRLKHSDKWCDSRRREYETMNELVDVENEMDEGRVTEGEENREQNAPISVWSRMPRE